MCSSQSVHKKGLPNRELPMELEDPKHTRNKVSLKPSVIREQRVGGLSLLLVGVGFLGYQRNKHFQRPPGEDEISFIFVKLHSWISKVPFPLSPVIEV